MFVDKTKHLRDSDYSVISYQRPHLVVTLQNNFALNENCVEIKRYLESSFDLINDSAGVSN